MAKAQKSNQLQLASIQPSKAAGRAAAEVGFVILEGPQNAALAFTPRAARATAAALIRAADKAEAQRKAKRRA